MAIHELAILLGNVRKGDSNSRSELHAKYADAAEIVLRRRFASSNKSKSAREPGGGPIHLLEKLVNLEGSETRVLH